MKFVFYILFLFSISLKSQIDFPKFELSDKTKHNWVAMGSSILVGEVLYQTTDLEGLSSAIGAAFGISITLAKEYIYDRYFKRGIFSVDDIIAGCFGAVTGGMVHRVIIDLRYRKEQKRLIKIRNSKELLD